MAKISVDIEYIKKALASIGYVISDCVERENYGLNWQLKFSNSGACVTVYDTNNKNNTVVNGKCEDGEQQSLKELVDGLKCKEILVDPVNKTVVDYINSKKEESYFDYKRQWHDSKKDSSLLHDILCLANNLDFRDAMLIIGVADDGEVVGVENWRKSNEVLDYLNSIKFAGGHIPEVEIKNLYYKYHKIDVLLIKSNENVPYFLIERYKDVGVQIYTRVGDTNTPKDKSASYDDIKKLWKRHFGIN